MHEVQVAIASRTQQARTLTSDPPPLWRRLATLPSAPLEQLQKVLVACSNVVRLRIVIADGNGHLEMAEGGAGVAPAEVEAIVGQALADAALRQRIAERSSQIVSQIVDSVLLTASGRK